MENKKNSQINEPIAEFLEKLRQQLEAEKIQKAGEKEAEIEETGESMALLYEKVRNLIEYNDDHLIKRNAIERILKRNLLIEFRREDFTEQFLEELAMSGYLEKGKRECLCDPPRHNHAGYGWAGDP